MSLGRRNRPVAISLGLAVALTVVAWIVGAQIRSPAQIAAETAAPDPSAITVPVERRVLSSEVIVRGTVRYGSPQPVVLPTSDAKQSTGASGESIVTTRPRRGARFGEGTAVMSVSGRPVFVLRGAQASHRDIGSGSSGPDVKQLEAALARMGFSPGKIDGRYDGDTAAAVADWYQSGGYEPFGPTDAQLEQLRTARASAAAARDAYLQSRVAIRDAATQGVTPGDIAQARIDLATARDAVNTAINELAQARARLSAARGLARQASGERLALLIEQRDNAVATADVAAKRAAVTKALNVFADAKRALDDAPPEDNATERAALREAGDDISTAQADLNAAIAAANVTRAEGRAGVRKARAEARQADRDANAAAADVARASKAVPSARRQATLADRRLQVLRTPGDTSLQQLLSGAAAKEARQAEADAARLARKSGVQVPADELLFFSTLPLRVDSVRVARGDSVSGRVMTVSNSRLAVDSSLSLSDAKLVRSGATVEIEEPDLGVKTTGIVSQVADAPGTHQVDPTRVYLEVSPKSAPAQLVGASVKLTIAVKSTESAVLVVPVTALSVGADGSARVQVQRGGGETEYVTVAPGLAAKGLVEVRPLDGQLAPGDLVIVGAGGSVDRGGSTPAAGDGAVPTPPGGTTGDAIESPPGDNLGGTGSSGPSDRGSTRSGTSPDGTSGDQPAPGKGTSVGPSP